MIARTVLLATAAAFSLSACARGLGPRGSPPEASEPDRQATVRVRNDGLSAVAIYERGIAARLGTVMPGQTRCLKLRDTSGSRRLVARPVGGGEPTVSPSFTAVDGEGWSWSLDTTPELDRLSLVRSDPCG